MNEEENEIEIERKKVAKEEISAVREMVTTWKKCYIDRWELDGEAVANFDFEIEEYIYPYVRRLFDMGILTQFEAQDLFNYAERELADLSRIVEARKSIGISKLEFYYNSNVKPRDEYYVDIENCLRIINELRELGIDAKGIDTDSITPKELDEVYRSVISATNVDKSIFNSEIDKAFFGNEVAAILLYEKKMDKNPCDVFPKKDESGKTIGCEEILRQTIERLKNL